MISHNINNEERENNQEDNKYKNKVNENINKEIETTNQSTNTNSRQISVNRENMRTRQPNRKYQDFYQFIMNQETNENIDMEVKEYDQYDAKIISMIMQHNSIGNNQTKIAGVCNTNMYSLNKGILIYGLKENQAVNKDLSQLHNREVFKPVML